jgi:membrane-associated phospholipid phosphatase
VIDASHLRINEAVGIVYFAYLAAAALVVPLPGARRLLVWAVAPLAIGLELTAARGHLDWLWRDLRDWLPALVILIGYFATGAFFVKPSARLESWLKGWDDRLIGGARFERLPAVLRLYLDVVYVSCFLMIPAGFGVLLWAGGAALTDRFWTLVLLAEFVAFGTLPWLQARPPWAIEGRRAADATTVRRFSLFWVKETSIRANTFPSGHASASLAVALGLAPAAPWAAVAFGVVAVSIAVGSVVGRFHYAIDAITGLLLAVAIWQCVAAFGM